MLLVHVDKSIAEIFYIICLMKIKLIIFRVCYGFIPKCTSGMIELDVNKWSSLHVLRVWRGDFSRLLRFQLEQIENIWFIILDASSDLSSTCRKFKNVGYL